MTTRSFLSPALVVETAPHSVMRINAQLRILRMVSDLSETVLELAFRGDYRRARRKGKRIIVRGHSWKRRAFRRAARAKIPAGTQCGISSLRSFICSPKRARYPFLARDAVRRGDEHQADSAAISRFEKYSYVDTPGAHRLR